MIWGSGGSKSNLAKAAGAEPAGQMRDEKLHTVVARSTFPSQNVQNHAILGPLFDVQLSKKCTPLWREAHFQVNMYKTSRSDHFWKLRCRKSARHLGAKHISKSKCTKHAGFGPLFAFRRRKSARCVGLKHVSKSKCAKHDMFGPLFDVQMWKKWTLTNLINLTNLTDFTTLSQLPNKHTN